MATWVSFSESCISDAYKDAYGSRPGQWYAENWNAMTAEQQEVERDRINAAVINAIEEDRRREAAAVEAVDAALVKLIQAGAKTRETALRWFLDSLGLSDFDKDYGGSYIEYKLGLPYGSKYRDEFDDYCGIHPNCRGF